MKLKLTDSEINALTSLLKATADKYTNIVEMSRNEQTNALVRYEPDMQQADLMQEMLYRAIFEEMWVKFQEKSFRRKKKYSITLQPHQAFAFHIEFAGIMDVTTHAGNLVQTICNQIHQQYQN